MNHGPGAGWEVLDYLAALAVVVAATGYATALRAARRRSPWPRRRTICWYLGLACAGASLIGPVATAAHTSFTGHMVGHLLLGMLAPLLMVLAAPITLLLRALPASGARRVTRILRWPVVRFLTHPVTAAVLNAGGLWLLYTTDLFHLMHASPAVYGLIHLHIFLAGYVFTASLVGVDPDPHRASLGLRSVVLIVFIAAHQILAKWLYAYPPAMVGAPDARVGAQVMFYGGDVVDVTIIVLLWAGWYRSAGSRVPGSGRGAAPARGALPR